ncbi:TPR domain protein [Paraphaeosphaeria sporulosa]
MCNLAKAYWDQGKWQEVKELQLQAMLTQIEMLGDKHPNTLTSMGNLASIYNNQEQYTDRMSDGRVDYALLGVGG